VYANRISTKSQFNMQPIAQIKSQPRIPATLLAIALHGSDGGSGGGGESEGAGSSNSSDSSANSSSSEVPAGSTDSSSTDASDASAETATESSSDPTGDVADGSADTDSNSESSDDADGAESDSGETAGADGGDSADGSDTGESGGDGAGDGSADGSAGGDSAGGDSAEGGQDGEAEAEAESGESAEGESESEAESESESESENGGDAGNGGAENGNESENESEHGNDGADFAERGNDPIDGGVSDVVELSQALVSERLRFVGVDVDTLGMNEFRSVSLIEFDHALPEALFSVQCPCATTDSGGFCSAYGSVNQCGRLGSDTNNDAEFTKELVLPTATVVSQMHELLVLRGMPVPSDTELSPASFSAAETRQLLISSLSDMIINPPKDYGTGSKLKSH